MFFHFIIYTVALKRILENLIDNLSQKDQD